MRVIATGRLKVRQYETREGGKGTSVDLDVDDIGPVLRSATAKVNRISRDGGGGGFRGGNQGGGGGGGFGGAPAGQQGGQQQSGSDAGQQGGSWGGSGGTGGGQSYDEPPF